MSHYFVLLVLVVVIPFAYSFERRVQFYRTWPALFKAMIVTLIPFIVWDILFTQHGIWHFNPAYTSQMTLAGLPIEEWLFFLAIPYSCLYIYAWVKYLRRGAVDHFSLSASRLLLISGVASLLIAFSFYDRSYTLVVFGTLGLTLILIRYAQPHFLKNFFIAFIISKLFFFLVNGYLTAKPIVLYDDNANLGFRIFTIPVEDAFYSLLLLLLNTFLYERFLRGRENGHVAYSMSPSKDATALT